MHIEQYYVFVESSPPLKLTEREDIKFGMVVPLMI